MSLDLEMPNFLPDALESGTLSYPAILSLYEGVQYLQAHGREMERRIYQLTCYLCEKLRQTTAYKTYSTPNECGIVAFAHKELQSEIIAQILSNDFQIAVRGGYHCAPLAHRAFKTTDGGLVRVSFSHWNTEKEIDELIFALRKIHESFEKGNLQA